MVKPKRNQQKIHTIHKVMEGTSKNRRRARKMYNIFIYFTSFFLATASSCSLSAYHLFVDGIRSVRWCGAVEQSHNSMLYSISMMIHLQVTACVSHRKLIGKTSLIYLHKFTRTHISSLSRYVCYTMPKKKIITKWQTAFFLMYFRTLFASRGNRSPVWTNDNQTINAQRSYLCIYLEYIQFERMGLVSFQFHTHTIFTAWPKTNKREDSNNKKRDAYYHTSVQENGPNKREKKNEKRCRERKKRAKFWIQWHIKYMNIIWSVLHIYSVFIYSCVWNWDKSTPTKPSTTSEDRKRRKMYVFGSRQ